MSREDPWELFKEMADESERRVLLGHFAAAFLHAATRRAVRKMKELPELYPVSHTGADNWDVKVVPSTSTLREVSCTHALHSGHVVIKYSLTEGQRTAVVATREFPTYPTEEKDVEGDAARHAEEIAAFLTSGQLPQPLLP